MEKLLTYCVLRSSAQLLILSGTELSDIAYGRQVEGLVCPISGGDHFPDCNPLFGYELHKAVQLCNSSFPTFIFFLYIFNA